MLVYEKAKPLTGIDLNYEVVGGLTPPTTFNKENTIWINTIVDKESIARPQATINGLQQNYYINATTGVITQPSSNTCYSKYFDCIEGHEYNFKLSDGQTVLIAHFNALPNKGATGTILYGNGKNTGLAELDYTIIGPAGIESNGITSPGFLGIWYYDSSANSSVPQLTITDLTEMNNIMNTLPDAYEITEHAFAHENPWVYYEDIDYIADSTIIQDQYLSTSGTVTAGDGTNAPCYTENYIPVEYGKTYNIDYKLSASKSMWLRIIEYTSTVSLASGEVSYSFKAYDTAVNQVTGTSQTLTYTPSASTVTHVRLTWRTFYPSGTTCTFSFVKPNVEFNTAVIGDTWIKTDIDKAPVSFNAIKRNELMIYPYKLKQWNGNKWKAMGGSLYQNDTAILIYNLQAPDLPYILKNGLKEQEDITGGWKIDKQGGNDKWYFFGYDESTQSIRFAQRNMTSCRYGWVTTNNKVNVSGWNKLVMRVSTYQGYGDADKCNGWVYVCLSNTQNAPMTSDDVLTADVVKGTYYYSTNSSKTEHIVEVDISDIDGEFYIVAGQRNKTSQKTFHCQIHDIYFED